MRKLVFLAIGMLAAGLASALTANWSWTSNGSNWQTSSSIYLVYSESQLTTADLVVKGTNSNYGEADGAKNSTGGVWSTPGDTVVTTTGSTDVFPESGNSVTAAFSGPTWNNVSDGYYYLVIFNNTSPEHATEFAVAQAGETGYVEVGNQTPSPGPDTPDPILYLDPVWIGGTFRDAAPEPTALALLALGVAGAALRRRVR